MGLKLSELDERTRARIAQLEAKARGDATRRKLDAAGGSIAGRVVLFVPGEPPKVTHQDKIIGKRVGKGGKVHSTLRDDPRLVAVREFYALYLPRNAGPKLAPPVQLIAEFRWTGDTTAYFTQKPDFDNVAKTLTDALVNAGWLEDDKHVALGSVHKLSTSEPKLHPPGVWIMLTSLLGQPVPRPVPSDVGRLEPL